jgi:hypothetical protein
VKKAAASTSAAAVRVIWSAVETGPMVESYVHQVLDKAAGQGVWGVELCNYAIDEFIAYRRLPALTAGGRRPELEERQAALRRISEHARRLGLRLGLWHHEISGPEDLLERMAELRAADGLINLDCAALYDYIRARIAEFFELFPTVDELVLTMTETQYPVAHRPFCDIPASERIRRLLQAITDVTEPLGKQLVIRPFSAIRQDELAVRAAVEQLSAANVSMMYKTEPFDWHPFLPDEELIGSVKRYEARMETDCGAEYYGQAVFPACYTRYLERRLTAARQKGATVAILRVDRGAQHTSLGHVIDEANILPVTHWLMRPQAPLAQHVREWMRSTWGDASAELADVLEQTFDVIRHSLYIDQQSISHFRFPSLEHAKHIVLFGLFEPGQPLEHMRQIWSVVQGRRTLPHAQILAEKQQALELSREIMRRFDVSSQTLAPAIRANIRESLSRLEVLAQACLQVCRLIAAHTEEMWELPEKAADPFDVEARRLSELTEQIIRRFGDPFFPAQPSPGDRASMTGDLRGWVEGLEAERKLELPLRRAMAAERGVLDYALCGFATEGHRLAKRLHTGRTFQIADRFVRESGVGPEQGFAYSLRVPAGTPLRMTIMLSDDGTGRAGAMRAGLEVYALDGTPFVGLRELSFDVPPAKTGELTIHFWSTTPQAVRVAAIKLTRRQ